MSFSARIPSFTPVYIAPNHKDFDTLPEAAEAQEKHEACVKRDTLFQCVGSFSTGKGCGQYSKVSEAEFVQTNWYVEPYGCTGGDYYRQGEGVAICPLCSRRNRLYDSPELTALKHHFKSVREEHDK